MTIRYRIHHLSKRCVTIISSAVFRVKYDYISLFLKLFSTIGIVINTAFPLLRTSSAFLGIVSITHRTGDDSSPSWHYNGVLMGAVASQITSLTIVYSAVYSGADQRKHQSSASPVTGQFPTQRASNAENVSIWWHHGIESGQFRLQLQSLAGKEVRVTWSLYDVFSFTKLPTSICNSLIY